MCDGPSACPFSVLLTCMISKLCPPSLSCQPAIQMLDASPCNIDMSALWSVYRTTGIDEGLDYQPAALFKASDNRQALSVCRAIVGSL